MQHINFLSVGYDYLKATGIQVKEGRGFSPDFPTDTVNQNADVSDQNIGSIILNEEAVRELNIKPPVIGQRIVWRTKGDTNYYMKLIGIVNNFHFASFKNEIKPFAFITNPRRVTNLTIKLSSQNISSTMKEIENKWKAFVPDKPMQYSFLNETFAQLYKAELNFQKIFFILVILSIAISCLGLFALSIFTAQQRVKEIGIRKKLGASISGIAVMLPKDFLKLIIISIFIASPLAYWVMNQWLQDYAYRIQVNIWVFFIAGVLSIMIAVITISFQSIKAAIANPVKSLRTE